MLFRSFAGALPLWLSPIQARVIPVSQQFDDYAKRTAERFREAGIRAEADLRNEKMGYKIRQAQLEKIPYMFIVGEKEAKSETVSVRKRGEGDIGARPVHLMIGLLLEEIRTRQV